MAGDADPLNKVTDDGAKPAEEQRRSAAEASKIQESCSWQSLQSRLPQLPISHQNHIHFSHLESFDPISNSVSDNLQVAASPYPGNAYQEAGPGEQGYPGASVRVSTTKRKLNTPKMIEGMTFKENKDLLDIWQLIIKVLLVILTISGARNSPILTFSGARKKPGP